MVSVSIVIHKTPEEQIQKALQCLFNSSVDLIYVIDNSPSDNLRSLFNNKEKVIYHHVENKGFGAGHNIAIKEAIKSGSNFHLVMNADVYWEGDIIGKITDYMLLNPKVGLISPKTYYPNGEIQYTCRMLPSPIDLFLKRFLPKKISAKRMKEYLLKDHDHDKVLNCPYLLGSFMFFRTEALKEIGLFDERFFMYPEDIDITRRIHEFWDTLFWPKVSIVHEHQQASKKSFKMFNIHFINMIKYFNKWGWFIDNKRKLYNNRIKKEIKNQLTKKNNLKRSS